MDEQSWQEVSDFASTSSSTDNIPTPTSTLSTISEPMPLPEKDILKIDQKLRPIDLIRARNIGNQSIADRTFLIRSREEPHLFITVCNGAVKCLPKPIPGGGSFWRCFKKDGWDGLRNTVSGGYLGLDNPDETCAKQPRQSANEYLTIDRDRNGSYILYVIDNAMGVNMVRKQVSISEDGKSLVAKREGGTVWDFIDSKYYQMSSSLVYPGLEPEKLR
ncbi:hypothetical protein FP744_10007467 [Trichoderma asperellum]|nr:hypothetical protein LI328DRAFT_56810 [Trichoderma asperelloides]